MDYSFKKKLLPLVLAGSVIINGCDEQQPQESNSNLVQDQKHESLEERLTDRLSDNPLPNGKHDRYAVLISGSNGLQFAVETGLVYQVLLEQGFKKEDVYILGYSGKERFFYPSDGAANKNNIERVFTYLGKKVDDQDLVVVNIANHGDRAKVSVTKDNIEQNKVVSQAVLIGDNITELEFERSLSQLKPQVGILTTDTCYGGGFARAIGKGKFVGISQTTDIHVGYCDTEDSFGGFFYSAFRENKESDKNKDGRVTLDEAFNYAKEKTSFVKKNQVWPQCYSELDITKISLE